MRRVLVVIWRTAVIVLPYFTIISSPITSFACERFNGSFNVSKLAILIGSSNYENFPLCTVHNDIGSISNQLKTSGYSVDYYENLSLASLTELFNRLDKPLHTFTGDFLLYFLGMDGMMELIAFFSGSTLISRTCKITNTLRLTWTSL